MAGASVAKGDGPQVPCKGANEVVNRWLHKIGGFIDGAALDWGLRCEGRRRAGTCAPGAATDLVNSAKTARLSKHPAAKSAARYFRVLRRARETPGGDLCPPPEASRLESRCARVRRWRGEGRGGGRGGGTEGGRERERERGERGREERDKQTDRQTDRQTDTKTQTQIFIRTPSLECVASAGGPVLRRPRRLSLYRRGRRLYIYIYIYIYR